MNLSIRKKETTTTGEIEPMQFIKNCLAFTPPKDPRRLVENLVRVILGRLLSENLARAGFERVHRFALDYLAEEMETIFTQRASVIKIAVLGPDLYHNYLGRAYSLTKFLERRYEVEAIGLLFRD